MKRNLFAPAILSAFAMLGACSGGGGGGSGGGIGTTPPPAPAPTPTPTPAPTPTPTPTPVATNADLLGPLVTESFANVAATGAVSYPTSGAPPTNSSQAITGTIRYDAATTSYALTVDGRTQTFGPSNIDPAQSNALITTYVRTNGNTTDSLTITKPGTTGTLTYKYVGSAFWQRTVNGTSAITGSFDAVAYGVKTPDAAVPRTGQAHYEVGLLGAFSEPAAVTGYTGSGTIQADFGSGRLVATLRLGPDGAPLGTWNGTGTIASSGNAFSGNFLAQIGFSGLNFAGGFDGKFFGPAAEELGATFQGRAASTGAITVGAITGRNVPLTGNADFDHRANPQFFAATTGHVEFDSTGNTTAPTGVAAGTSSIVIGFRPGADLMSSGLNFFLPNRAAGLRQLADQYDMASSPGYAGLGSTMLTAAASWQQYHFEGVYKYLKAGRFVSVNGTHFSIDDFVIGMPTPTTAVLSGTGGYELNLRGTAYSPSTVPAALFGGGFLTIDFATGAITATGDVRDYGNSSIVYGVFTGTGQLASTSRAFTGTWNVAGAKAFTGTWTGSLFGPAAQELGARFQASAGDGSLMSGALFGPRNDSVAAAIPKLADLTARTTLTGMQNFTYGSSRPGDAANTLYGGDTIAVDFDPVAGSYTLRSTSTTNIGAPRIDLTFDKDHIDTARSDADFVFYRSANGNADARIYRLAGAGRPVQLTYSNIALIIDRDPDRTGPGGRIQRSHIVFGVETPVLQMPRAGSASYSGRAWGSGFVSGIGESADVTGTMDAQANFGSGEIGITLDLIASDPDGLLPSRSLGSFLLSGSRYTNQFSGGRNHTDYSYGLNGTFYGPNAAEIGGGFSLSKDLPFTGSFNPDFKIVGVFAGPKR